MVVLLLPINLMVGRKRVVCWRRGHSHSPIIEVVGEFIARLHHIVCLRIFSGVAPPCVR